jgi:excisionase family DNA binding protein
MKMAIEKELYTVAEVAEKLLCSTKHIYRKIDTGELAAMQLGERMLRITKEDLDELLRVKKEEGLSIQKARM